MKHFIAIFFFIMMSYGCSKSKSTNVLTGKWLQLRVIEEYTNPYTQNDQLDTLAGASVSVEFKGDGSFFTNGTQDGTYSILNDTSFALKPLGNISIGYIYTTYSFVLGGNEMLKIRRQGNIAEQKQVFNPDMQGIFKYAKILYVFTEYQKQ